MSNLQSVIENCGVHPALGAEASGWWIEQSPYELAAFIDAITPLGIKTVLEIGTGHKMGLARFMSEVLGWKVVSVDIHQPVFRAPLVDLRVSETRLDFPDTTFDLLIIDADHHYDSVKADYEHYGKYASKVVMFHDVEGLRDCEGAHKHWKEISRHLAPTDAESINIGFHEIFDPHEDSACGIGWIDVQAVKALEDLQTASLRIAQQMAMANPPASLDVPTLIDGHVDGTTIMINPQPQMESPVNPPPSPSPKKKPGRKSKGNT